MLNALGIYIFGGSQSIAHIQSGFNVNDILEMTEDMVENNAYHFNKNYPHINIWKPSEWTSEGFLNNLNSGNQYDLLYANNPCSGLSYINRNANVNQPINNKFFDVFNVVKILKPKTFLIENAPTTVTIGTPILQQMIEILGDDYKFTIIRDRAGHHAVPMKRMRTLIIGWNRETFNNIIPIINRNKKNPVFANIIGDCDEETNINNKEFINSTYSNLSQYYNLIEPGSSVLRTCCKYYDKMNQDFNKAQANAVKTMKPKLDNNQNVWDKSPFRLYIDRQIPSLTSLSCFIHPVKNRELYIREYARIMGYPEDFIFYPEECKCSTIQCIAQGVPVNFIKYISKEIIKAINNNYNNIEEDVDVIFQNHISCKYYKFTKEQFSQLDKLNSVNSGGIPLVK